MNVIELTNEEYIAVMEARESLEEMNKDIKYAYLMRRKAERNSGRHANDSVRNGNNEKEVYKQAAKDIRDTGYNNDLKDIRDQHKQASNSGKKINMKNMQINKGMHDKYISNLERDERINSIRRSGGQIANGMDYRNSNDRKRDKKAAIKAKLAANK